MFGQGFDSPQLHFLISTFTKSLKAPLIFRDIYFPQFIITREVGFYLFLSTFLSIFFSCLSVIFLSVFAVSAFPYLQKLKQGERGLKNGV